MFQLYFIALLFLVILVLEPGSRCCDLTSYLLEEEISSAKPLCLCMNVLGQRKYVSALVCTLDVYP